MLQHLVVAHLRDVIDIRSDVCDECLERLAAPKALEVILGGGPLDPHDEPGRLLLAAGELVDAGLVSTDDEGRHYRLTPEGETLTPVLQSLYDWGRLSAERNGVSFRSDEDPSMDE